MLGPKSKPQAPVKAGNNRQSERSGPKPGKKGTRIVSKNKDHQATAGMESGVRESNQEKRRSRQRKRKKPFLADNVINLGSNQVQGLDPATNGEQITGLSGIKPAEKTTGGPVSQDPAQPTPKLTSSENETAAEDQPQTTTVLPKASISSGIEAINTGTTKPSTEGLTPPDSTVEGVATTTQETTSDDLSLTNPAPALSTPAPGMQADTSATMAADPGTQAGTPAKTISEPAETSTEEKEARLDAGGTAQMSAATSPAQPAEPPTDPQNSNTQKPKPEKAPTVQTAQAQSDKTPVAQKAEQSKASGKEKAEEKPQPKPEGIAANPLDEAGGFAAAEIPEPELDTSSSAGIVKQIADLPPTQQIKAIRKAGPAFTESQVNETGEAKASLPVIQQPTGLGRDDFEQPEVKKPERAQPTDLKVGGRGGQNHVDTHHPDPLTPTPGSDIPDVTAEEVNTPESFLARMQRLQTTDSGVSTNAGKRPNVNLEGDADPNQNLEKQEEANAQVGQEKTGADEKIYQDFGEHDMYPTLEPETLSAEAEFQEPKTFESKVEDLPPLTDQIVTSLDPAIKESQQEKFDESVTKSEAAQAEYTQKSEQERQDSLTEIETETEKTKLEQKKVQDDGKAEVQSHRESWQAENDAVVNKYNEDVQKEQEKTDQKIDTELTKADEKVETELSKAEEKAEKKKQEAEAEAKRKKEEAEEKRKNRSWWQRIGDAIGDFFNWLKAAVATIFDALRSVVKGIIEAAKAIVSGIIDFARNLVVGLIKAFAAVLKTIVSVVLFAFPEVAAKFNKWIDEAVEFTIKAIDALADALKSVVNFLLDALGTIVTLLLDIMQAAIIVYLMFQEFLLTGNTALFDGIANLIETLSWVPTVFKGQLTEEFLGFNVQEKLPFERDEHPDFSSPEGLQDAGATDELPSVLTKDPLEASDFEIDPMEEIELEPEVEDSLYDQLSSGPVELGESDDPERNMDFIRQSMVGGGAAGGTTTTTGENEGGTVNPAANLDLAGLEPEERAQKELDAFMAAQEKPSCGADASSAGKQAEETTFPDDQKIGPFTDGQRMQYMMKQMKNGVFNWWECNKPVIIAAAIIVALVAIVAIILSGGAILSAIPPLLQIMAAFFIGDAILRSTKYFKQFLTEGFDGNHIKGAEGFARGAVIIGVELIFALLFDLNAILKAIKGGVKSTLKSIAAGAKNTFKSLAAAGRQTAINIGRNVVKIGQAGKFLFKGVGKGVGKGVKSLKQLGKRLLDNTSFKGLYIDFWNKGLWLFARINPDIPIAPISYKNLRSRVKNAFPGTTDEITEIARTLLKKLDKDQIAKEELDWLLKRVRGADDDAKRILGMMAKDSRTPWRTLKEAANAVEAGGKVNWAGLSGRLRGISGEVATEIALLSGRLDIGGRQLRYFGSQFRTTSDRVLDFVVHFSDDAGKKILMEVKAWTTDRWTRTLSAFEEGLELMEATGKSLDNVLTGDKLKAAKEIERMIDQLRAGGADSILTVTDNITEAQMSTLKQIITEQVGLREVITIGNREVIDISMQIKRSLGIIS